MRHAIRCNKCGMLTSVNGQEQISHFVGEHIHDNRFAGMTGANTELDNPQDSIDLGIDPKPLITGLPYRKKEKDS